MRFGVSAKILLAYALLLAAFAALSAFTLGYLQRARAHVEMSVALSSVSRSLETALGHLESAIADAEPAGRGKMVAVHMGEVLPKVDAALAGLDALAKVWPWPLRDAGAFHPQRSAMGLLQLRQRLDGLRTLQGDEYGREARLVLARIRAEKHPIENEIGAATASFTEEELRARDRAVALGAAGLLVALGAAFFIGRTLRPLRVLRLRAREVAGGDYARRIGLRSRDEIGDLAREFDAMAEALQEREQRLIRSERLATVGRVAAQITHEIRNPLASIGLNTELLADELPRDNEEGRRLLAAIAAEVDRLSDITETYLRFVRLPKPKRELEDPGALVASVVEFARAELAQGGVGLDVDVAPDLPEIAVDESQIRQVLINLVRNAREAMPTGGSLRVLVRRAEGGVGVEVVVADTGPGIAPEHRARVFEPFFSTKERGTGLGLALVHQVVNEHGGQITIDAPAAGGTRFVITLPEASSRVNGAAITAPAAAAEGPRGLAAGERVSGSS